MDDKRGWIIKSYFAASLEAAMQQARRELGPDALFLESRPAPPEAQAMGACEAVFATAPPPEAARPAEDLPKEMRAVRELLARLTARLDGGEACDRLAAAGLEPELAAEITRASARAPLEARRARDPQHEDRALEAELRSRIAVDSELAGIVALVGPPGAGKTTTLVKLALARGLQAGRSVALISADAFRIAAAEQLRCYAAILGVPFAAVETPVALEHAIQEHEGKRLILIDTAGSLEEAAPLAGLLGRPDIQTHLVLPAWMRPADLYAAARRFEILHPARLLFTRLDETGNLGAIYSLAAATGKPLSFFTAGQSIPEDLQPASSACLVESILGSEARRAAA